MEKVTSADGTKLAFDRFGSGPPLVMVAGAFSDHSATEPLGRALANRLEIFNLDRRGRGESDDTQPYAVEREIEDLEAVIGAAGGSAAVLGHSSGGNLVLKAAAAGLSIDQIVLYEPPFNPDDSFPPLPDDLSRRLAELVQDGKRGDAVELYQTAAIGIPEEVVAQMRTAPFWSGMEAIAHTLSYDAAVVGDRRLPREMLASIEIPTLVLRGEESPPFMHAAAGAVAAAMPAATLVSLAGQGHEIEPTSTATAIEQFIGAPT